MPVKFNIDGTTSTFFQIGKKGPKVKTLNDELFFRDDTDNFYVKVHGGYPTENSHLTTKAYVDAQASSDPGKIVTGTFGSSAEWILNHNLDATPILWNVFDNRDEAVIPDRVDVSNPNIAYFYFTPDTAGSVIVASGFVTQESEKFYGITVSETDGSPSFSGINKLNFDSNSFYIERTSVSSDEVTIAFRNPDKYRHLIIGGIADVGKNATIQASYGNNSAIADPLMAFSGSVIAISISLTAARTTGTCTMQVKKNGVAQTAADQTAIIDAVNTQTKYTILASPITYVAGDRIGLQTVTAGTFNNDKADATLLAYCEETI